MTVPVVEGSQFWKFDDVEARLVEAMEFQRRLPGGGGWPFASDGPWHLIVKDWWDWSAHEERPLPTVPLTNAQIARMNEALGWVLLVPSSEDRRLIAMAVRNLATGRKSVPWTKLLKPMGVKHGAHGLRKRYSRAITCICNALNGAEMRA
ncbi:hypothetical protein AI27_17930 [Sphingomonas sp. BHC-A]|jgi:hypothetical protein|nr:hypothetical protein AI27_17930 [Sphingomonas sp. BHC-A]